MTKFSHPLCSADAEPYRWNTDLNRWEFWWDDEWRPSSIYLNYHPRPDVNWIYNRVVLSYEHTWAEPVKFDE